MMLDIHIWKVDLNTALTSSRMQRDALSCMPSGKCKLKQWYATMYLSEWPKSETLTTPNAGEDVEQQKLYSLLAGMQNRTKYSLTIQFRNHAPWHLPKGVENSRSHKTLHTDIYCGFITISKTWQQQRCPTIGEWINCDVPRQWSII